MYGDITMKGFQSKTASMTSPGSKLGGSNLGKSTGGLGNLSVAKGTTAQGDYGNTTGLKAGASTFAHEQNGSVKVAAPAGGPLAAGERKGPPGNA